MQALRFIHQIVLSSFIYLLSANLSYAAPNKITTLDWMDLIPKKERNHFNQKGMINADHTGQQKATQHVGAVRPDLDKKLIRIPGFVVPLEGTKDTITEFLLVPYFGACIHVPPPPPNQIVYVKFDKGAPVKDLWDVVYVVGKLRTITTDNDLGNAGYSMQGMRIEPYNDE